MNLFKKLLMNLKDNAAELYTLLVLVVAVPAALSLLVGYRWGFLLSFTLQAVIGVLYIRGTYTKGNNK